MQNRTVKAVAATCIAAGSKVEERSVTSGNELSADEAIPPSSEPFSSGNDSLPRSYFPAELQSHAYEIAIGMASLRGGGSNLTPDLVVFGESLGGHFSLEVREGSEQQSASAAR